MAELPPLKALHADSSLSQVKLDTFRKLTNEELLDSLSPGQPGSLKAGPDGTMIEGHHRIRILRDRRVDVDSLPREIVSRSQVGMKVLPTIYSIAGPWKGQLAIVPRPRGEDWLEDEVRAWREGGVDVIVSLLTANEARELSLVNEAAQARASGLRFLQFPIPDYGVPFSFEDVLAFVEKLDEALTAGKNVGIHCRQGIGRSSLMAGALLVMRGTDPEEAFNRVALARGRPVPDTSEQREWVTNFARYLHSATARRQVLVES